MKKFAIFLLALTLFSTPALGNEHDDASISQTGDAAAGRVVFQKCGACHNLRANTPPRLGPNLDNIFGRMAGTSKNYTRYSKALKDSGIVWSEKELDKWLSDPNNYLPGNKMPFAGLRADQDRADLIAYLRAATE